MKFIYLLVLRRHKTCQCGQKTRRDIGVAQASRGVRHGVESGVLGLRGALPQGGVLRLHGLQGALDLAIDARTSCQLTTSLGTASYRDYESQRGTETQLLSKR